MVRRLAMVAALGFAGWSCAAPLTQVLVCYEVEQTLIDMGTRVTLCITDLEGNVLRGCDGTYEITFSGTTQRSQAIVQESASGVAITLEGDVPSPTGSTRLTQSIRVPFVEGQITDVVLRLQSLCLVGSCDPGETCVVDPVGPRRRCVEEEASEACLAPHGGPYSDRATCDQRTQSFCPAAGE